MKPIHNAALCIAAVFAVLLGLSANAATFESCDKWATWSNGGYTVRNNVWGSNPGWQCLWANNGANWGVSCNHGTSGGIKSYPHSAKYYGRSTSSFGYCGTWFSVSRPGNGAYCTTFDIWGNGEQHEVMLWMNKQGAVGPIGSLRYSNVSVGGHTWNVYRGNNGSINVMSFVRTSNTNSGNVDHKAIWNWIQARGWWNNPRIDDVQFGFEITNTAGGNHGYTCNGRSDWNG